MRIKSFCAEPEDIEGYSPLTDEDGRRYDLALLGPIKNGFTARIAQITTKEEADALKGTALYARRDQLPSLPDDEFYHADLIGLTVTDTGGEVLGTVKTVQNHGADDLLACRVLSARCPTPPPPPRRRRRTSRRNRPSGRTEGRSGVPA